MNPHLKFQLSRMVGLAIAVLGFAGPASHDATAGTLPQDPCALLKPAEIQAALDPNAQIGKGEASKTLSLAVSCTYSWGPRTKEWGDSALTITVLDASKAWPGTSPDLLKQGVFLKAKTSGPNASEIPGIGDAAVFTIESRSNNATAEAYLKAKDVHISVVNHGGSLVQNKEKLIALLKQAAARL